MCVLVLEGEYILQTIQLTHANQQSSLLCIMIVLFHTHIEPESTQVQTKLPINDTNTIYYNDSKILIIKSAGWLEIINNEEALVQNFVPDSSIHQNPKE